MVTEAILKWFLDRLGQFINPILAQVINGVDLNIAYFPVPAPLWDYFTYTMQNITTILPVMVLFWAWRQIKA